MDPLRILVVDDHSLFRQGIVSLLADHQQLEVVGQAKNGFTERGLSWVTVVAGVWLVLVPFISGYSAIQAAIWLEGKTIHPPGGISSPMRDGTHRRTLLSAHLMQLLAMFFIKCYASLITKFLLLPFDPY